MKKVIYISIFALTLILIGCSEDFLETKNLYEQYDNEYYSNFEDIDEALTAAYACLSTQWARKHPVFLANLMSDDCFGGGGSNDFEFHETVLLTAAEFI